MFNEVMNEWNCAKSSNVNFFDLITVERTFFFSLFSLFNVVTREMGRVRCSRIQFLIIFVVIVFSGERVQFGSYEHLQQYF